MIEYTFYNATVGTVNAIVIFKHTKHVFWVCIKQTAAMSRMIETSLKVVPFRCNFNLGNRKYLQGDKSGKNWDNWARQPLLEPEIRAQWLKYALVHCHAGTTEYLAFSAEDESICSGHEMLDISNYHRPVTVVSLLKWTLCNDVIIVKEYDDQCVLILYSCSSFLASVMMVVFQIKFPRWVRGLYWKQYILLYVTIDFLFLSADANMSL